MCGAKGCDEYSVSSELEDLEMSDDEADGDDVLSDVDQERFTSHGYLKTDWIVEVDLDEVDDLEVARRSEEGEDSLISSASACSTDDEHGGKHTSDDSDESHDSSNDDEETRDTKVKEEPMSLDAPVIISVDDDDDDDDEDEEGPAAGEEEGTDDSSMHEFDVDNDSTDLCSVCCGDHLRAGSTEY